MENRTLNLLFDRIRQTLLPALLVGTIPAQAQVLDWGRRAGGSAADLGLAVATDPFGNVLSTGQYRNNVNFNPIPGPSTVLQGPGIANLFVWRLTPEGELSWARGIGETGRIIGFGIDTDAQGNVYATGYMQGEADFDPGPDELFLSATPNQNNPNNFSEDIFVLSFDPEGDLRWAFNLGGGLNDRATCIHVDANGDVLVGGWFVSSADFDPGPDEATLTSNGSFDGFILKLDGDGNFLWAVNIGGTGSDEVLDIDTDPAGNVYATGFFRGTVDFDPGPGTATLTAPGNATDAFVLKLAPDGSYRWAGRMGSSNEANGRAIAVKDFDAVYVGGQFSGQSADLDPGPGTAIFGGNGLDAYVVRLDTAGTFEWGAQLGGSSSEEVLSLSVNSSGDLLVSGRFAVNIDLDPGDGSLAVNSNGQDDAFLCLLMEDGQLLWGYGFGGTSLDAAYATFDLNDDVCVTGFFINSIDLDPGPDELLLNATGENDIYVKKLSSPSTSIREQTKEDLQVFPNPASGQLFVRMTDVAPGIVLRIMDATGREVRAATTGTSDLIELDVRGLSAGAYLLHLEGQPRSTRQVIIAP